MDFEVLKNALEKSKDEIECAIGIAVALENNMPIDTDGDDNTIGGLQFCISMAFGWLNAARHQTEQNEEPPCDEHEDGHDFDEPYATEREEIV